MECKKGREGEGTNMEGTKEGNKKVRGQKGKDGREGKKKGAETWRGRFLGTAPLFARFRCFANVWLQQHL
jgi:hypothetical protein